MKMNEILRMAGKACRREGEAPAETRWLWIAPLGVPFLGGWPGLYSTPVKRPVADSPPGSEYRPRPPSGAWQTGRHLIQPSAGRPEPRPPTSRPIADFFIK